MKTNEKIAKLRQSAGLLQEELAKTTGVDVSVVSRWESGQRQIKVEDLSKISDLFGVSVDYLAKEDCFYTAQIPLKGIINEGQEIQFLDGSEKKLIFVTPGNHPWQLEIMTISEDNQEYGLQANSFCLMKKGFSSVDLDDIYLILDNEKPYFARAIMHDNKISFETANTIKQDVQILSKLLSVVHPLCE